MTSLLESHGVRPGITFGLVAAAFTVAYASIRSVSGLADLFVPNRSVPVILVLVVVSSVSAFVVGVAVWQRFVQPAHDSRYRPAVAGGVVGVLSMPVTMYGLSVGRYLFGGLPENVVVGSPPPGMTTWVPIQDLLLQDVSIALYASLFGFVLTGGLPVVVGALTGESLRRAAGRTPKTGSDR